MAGDGCGATCLDETGLIFETEPNDTRATATVLPGLNSTPMFTVAGETAANEADFFRFRVPAPGRTLTVRTYEIQGDPTPAGCPSIDTVVAVWDNAGDRNPSTWRRCKARRRPSGSTTMNRVCRASAH